MLPGGGDRILWSFGLLLRRTDLHPFARWTPNPLRRKRRYHPSDVIQTRYPAQADCREGTQRGASAPHRVGDPQAGRNLSIAVRNSWHCRKATVSGHASQGNQYVTNRVRFTKKCGFFSEVVTSSALFQRCAPLASSNQTIAGRISTKPADTTPATVWRTNWFSKRKRKQKQ